MDPVSILNLSGALIIAGVWMLYLHFLDIFRAEKWRHLILTFILGALTPWLVLLAAPLLDTIGFRLNAEPVNDFLFSVFGIGLIEETAKVLPFLFIIFILKIADEPIDYIIYASVSALGFATMENLIYFDRYGPEIMLTRGLLSVLGHIVDTSIIAYGIVVYKFRPKIHPLLHFFWFLFLAAMVHGLYDYFIISKYFYGSGFFLTLLVWFLLIELWATINNNCLNNSPHFSKKKVIDSDKLQAKLLYSFGIVLLFQILAVSYSEGLVAGISKSMSGIFLNAFLIAIVAVRISRFKLVPDRWKPIRLRMPFSFRLNPNGLFSLTINGESFNEVHINKHLGENVIIVPLRTGTSRLTEPFRGYIEDKIFLKNDEQFYLVSLEKPFHFRGYRSDKILLKAKSTGLTLIKQKFPLSALLLIPEDHTISANDTVRSFGFLEWVYLVI